MIAALGYALARLRVRRTRTVLTVLGITAAGAMLGAAVTVSYALGTGFERTADRADLPDIAATFAPTQRADVERVARSLPNVVDVSFRLDRAVIFIAAGGRTTERATAIGVQKGDRRGYAIVEGRDIEREGEAVIEAGLARAWNLSPGDEMFAEALNVRLGLRLQIVGVAVSPDGVAYPLASSPLFYVDYRDVAPLIAAVPGTVDTALIWLANPDRVDVTLSQARAAGVGVDRLRFGTRESLRLLIGQAAGLVIALLVAFSLISLVVAGTMLAASSAAEVQRRVQSIGLMRALGMSTGQVTAAAAVEGTLIAAPAGAVGIALGWFLVAGPTSHLLASLNQFGPGLALAPLLIGSFFALVLIVAGFSACPAWRAARRPAVETLRGGDMLGSARALPLPAGAAGLGVRLVAARPVRMLGGVIVLGLAAALILLVLSIASVLRSLDQRPQAFGTRYQLTLPAGEPALEAANATSGVAGAATRFEVLAADSFRLGEPFKIISFAGDHTQFEDPVLDRGRHLRNDDEAEVGLGLATALGLQLGGTLAAQLPSGAEIRFKVVGIVRAFQDQGRIAYVNPKRLLAADPSAQSTIVVRVAPGFTVGDVSDSFEKQGILAVGSGGIAGQSVQGFAARSSGFLDVVIALLRSIAIVSGVVCLYAVAQVLALTAHERRRSLAVVRSFGASRAQIALIFAGAAGTIGALALPMGVVVERFALGSMVASLAASYISLPLTAGLFEITITAASLALGAAVVALLLGRAATSRSVVVDLTEE
ncbi:FtsX-like permease family protein [Gaiella sp.]|uniref:ABC transporter permease n=1 Tax=Gaiella sp. TaxID=2663207 RepID=UPI0032654761